MKPRSKNSGSFILLGTIIFLNLVALLFLKYNLNGLSLSNFRLDYIGNVLNLFISVMMLVGILIQIVRGKNVDIRRARFLIALQFFITLSLSLAYVVTKFDIVNPVGYLFNFPVKKVYTGFLFIIGALVQIYSLLYIWGLIYGAENLFEIRTFIRSIIIVVLLLVFSLFNVWNVRLYDEKKIPDAKFEYGCIPGAAVWSRGKPSPIFEGRIRKAFELYKKGIIKQVILTGGNAPGEISESESAYKYLRNLDIPEKKLRIETQSSTTTLQIKFLSREYFYENNSKPILIISDGFHLTRIVQIAKFFNVNVIGVSSDYSMSFDKTLFYRARESVALLLFWFFAI